MKTLIGRRYPRLFFTDEEGEPFYFKEEAVMPAVPPPYPKIVTVQGMTSRDHNFSFVNNAMDAGGLAPGTRISDRNIATWELSKFLGVSDIIIPVERGSFTYKGEKLDGIKMPPAADEDYAAYLSHMEEAAAQKGDNWDMRFSHRPTYLERFILTHRKL